MDLETIKRVREELLGQRPVKKLIDLVVQKRENDDALHRGTGTHEDLEREAQAICLTVINTFYHNNFKQIDQHRREYSLSKEDLTLLTEIAVDLAHAHNEHAKAFSIIEFMPLDTMRTTKIVMSFLEIILQAGQYEAAGKVWNKYKDLGVSEQSFHDLLQSAFKKVMTFQDSVNQRDYTKVFEFQKLFQLPRDITYSIVSEEYEENRKAGNYLTAATISQMFGLNPNVTNDAALQAWRSCLLQFQKNLDQGQYQTFDQPAEDDPYLQAKQISDEFHLFDYQDSYGNYDKELVKKIQDMAIALFEKLRDPNQFMRNAGYARIFFAHRCIQDYQLMNHKIAANIADKTSDGVVKLLSFIQEESKSLDAAKKLKPILDDLVSKVSSDNEVIDELSIQMFHLALEAKDLEYAKKIYATYSLNPKDVLPKLAVYANDLANAGQFDLLLDFIEMFELQKMLKDNKHFMEKIDAYYDENMQRKRYLKSFAIADLFQMKNKKRVAPIKLLIDDHLKEHNLTEIHHLMKKYKIRKKDVRGSAKLMYKDVVTTDKNFAVELRKDFELSIFDVGIFTWLMYEVLNMKSG